MDNGNVIISESNSNFAVMPLSASSSNNFIDLEVFDLDEALAVVEETGRVFAVWKSFVSNLPTVKEVKEDDVCSICMEGFLHHNSDGENKRVPCGHMYHSNCITLWLEHCNSCPLCRHRISLHF
ncbi:hypothetical protein VNO77_00305 [Canavalia gladiata]|uniref:RING-type E3 ubiquitin transferase n=1 Tax=Canavalia gladiata TaxID=3824 RepID=A0AAN9MTY5_CANGL